jgi:BolA protein
MDILDIIKNKLEAAFAPSTLKVVDDSVQHYGHDGATPGQVSHVAMLIVSDAFAGVGRVARTRMVYDLLAAEIAAIHAVTALKTLTPAEYEAQAKAG